MTEPEEEVFVLLYFVLLCLVCVFSCTILFVSISQVIGCVCLQNDLEVVTVGTFLFCKMCWFNESQSCWIMLNYC